MLPDLQDISEIAIVIVARAALGLFLSSILGLLTFVITLPIVQSIWKITEINAALMGVLVFGFGAGLGSFLGWFNRDLSRTVLILMLLMSLVSALFGAWGGLHNSRDAYKMVGIPGIPALAGINVGALLGGNIFNLAAGVFRAARNPRLR